jgi:hypothetical protein
MAFKIPGLPDNIQERLDSCHAEISLVLDKYFPEFRASYKDNFDDRLYMTLYIELIHAGFFKTEIPSSVD